MNSFVSVFCPMAYLAANSCAMAALYTVFSIVEGMDRTDPALGIWLICLCACQLGLQLFLRSARSERSVIYFIASFFVLQLVLSFTLQGFFSGFFITLIVIAMWLYSYFSCFELCVKKLSPERLTKSFDLCCLVLVFTLFFCSVKSIAVTAALPLAMSTLLSLLALILIRGGEQRRLRGALLGGGLVLAFGAAAACMAALASGGIRRMVDMLLALLRFIGRSIDAFFMFMLSLLPQRHYNYELPEAMEGLPQGPAQDMGFELADPKAMLIAVLLLGIALAAGVVIFRIIRGAKPVSMVKIGGERNIKRRRMGLGSTLAEAFRRLWRRISFRLMCISKRSTAPGLLMEIEKRSRATLHGRAESETCREFLKRAVAVYPHAESELMQLADNMDIIAFGGGVSLPSAEIARLRNFIFSKEQ